MDVGNNKQSLTDQEIYELSRKDKDAAFRQLYKKYANKIISFVYYIVKNMHHAEELAQEAFLKAYVALDRFKPNAKISTWLYQIAKNLAYSHIKHKNVESTVSFDKDIKTSSATTQLSEVLSDNATPTDNLLQEETKHMVKEAIKSLPEKYREVAVLCGIQGLSYQEAAKILKCSTYLVGVRLMRAKTQLLEILKPQ